MATGLPSELNQTVPNKTLGEEVEGPTLAKTSQDVATQAFETAVSPLRSEFKERLGGTVESLAQRGIQFGGVGGERLSDIFQEQQRLEAGIASRLGAELGKTEIERAFQASEAAKNRSLQRELQTAGFEFSAGESQLGREFASVESEKVREFQKASQEAGFQFASTEAEIDRETNRRNQILGLVLEGNLDQSQVQGELAKLYGEGAVLTTRDELGLQRIAEASGLTVEDYTRLRGAIGTKQGELILGSRQEQDIDASGRPLYMTPDGRTTTEVTEQPKLVEVQNIQDFIQDPAAARRFQVQLAKIQGDVQRDIAREQSKGSGMSIPLIGNLFG